MNKFLATLLIHLPLSLPAAEPPATLIQMSGVRAKPASLSDSVLVIIDAQREYLDGALPLDGIEEALNQSGELLARARKAGTPVVHVVHRGGGGRFNPDGPFFNIVESLRPQTAEMVIEKQLPNAFAGTRLQQTLEATGRRQLILIGFMTHMCLSSTARAALDQGFTTTIVASATATRDLPDGQGGMVPAVAIQQASLAALADRFATLAMRSADIPD